MTLTKSEIVEDLNNEIGLNKREAKELVDSLFDHIKDLLEDGQEVKLSGFGNFQLKEAKNVRRKTQEYIQEIWRGSSHTWR